MSAVNTDSEWTDDIESLLEKLRTNCVILQKAHKQKYHTYKHRLSYFRVPIIIMSGCNSVLSVSLQKYISQSNTSIITCIISLLVGLIGSVELFLSIQSTMELELSLSKDYYALAITIFRMLQLNRSNRSIDPNSFLDNCYSQYENLYKKSDLLKKKVFDDLIPINVLKIPSTPTKKDNDSDV